MAKVKGASNPAEGRAEIAVERTDAKARIEAQIAKGEQLRNRQFTAEADIEAAWQDYYKWEKFVYELLGTLFTSQRFAEEFRGFNFGRNDYSTPQIEIEAYREDVAQHISDLESIRDRLELIPESPFITRSVVASEPKPPPVSNKVFIVHGHDESAKQSAARFVEKFGLKAIILHEMTDGGKTIIEKVEESSGVAYAIILHTADDVGSGKAEHAAGGALRGRSRQNVVFEHGYFVGKLGRGHMTALLKGDVEIPSDLQGIVYTKMDETRRLEDEDCQGDEGSRAGGRPQ